MTLYDFLLGGTNSEDYEKFLSHSCKYTRKKNPVTGASGGATTYEITPTSIGVVTKVRCKCGEKKDITDYGCW